MTNPLVSHGIGGVRLAARGLGKDFDRRPVLSGITFEAQTGQVWMVTGRNGVGKSTLLRILAGLTRPTRGHVEILKGGVALKAASSGAVGYLAPDLRPYEELTVTENLLILARIKGLNRAAFHADRLVATVGLTGRESAPVGTLSTGQCQRLKLALAILGDPPVLLLDEPGVNLDADGRDVVRRVVEESRGRGPVIVATNDPEETRLGDNRLELEPVDVAHARGF